MDKPWINHTILDKCSRRDSILKSLSNERDPIKITNLRAEFRALRNEITSDKRRGKRLHYEAFFESNKHKTSKLWEGIRALVNISTSKSANIKLIDDCDDLITDKGIIANTFNDHFSSIGQKVGSSILPGQGHYKDYLNKCDVNNKPFINPPNSFFLSPTVPDEVQKIITSLNLKKISGSNEHPYLYLKNL